MARPLKPETAAGRIIKMVAAKEATNAADAVRKDPTLAPGQRLVEQAGSTQAASRPTGSGSAKLVR